MARTTFREVPVTEVNKYLGPDNICIHDLYVKLPTLEKYVMFVSSGDQLTEAKLERVRRHIIPTFYVVSTDAPKAPGAPAAPEEMPRAEVLPKEYANTEVLGATTIVQMKKVFQALTDPYATDFTKATEQVEAMAEGLMQVVAPEVGNLKERIIKNTKYLHLMNDSAAISSIAVMFAFANGFQSKEAYKDLTSACLLMDLALSDITDEHMKLWYQNREKLPKEVIAKFLDHPARSCQIIQGRLKGVSITTMQLVQSHHELHNGQGFPRGVPTESLFPTVPILSFAVDVFEVLKKAELNEKPITVGKAVRSLRNEKIDLKQRRHSKKVVDNVVKFLESNPDASGESSAA